MLSNLNIAFFVNANHNIGNGHLSRCLAIANEFLKHDFRINFIVPNSFKTSVELPSSSTVYFCDFDNLSNVQTLLKTLKIDIVLIDLIQFEYELLSYLDTYRNQIYICSITLFDFNNQIRYEHLSFFPDFTNNQSTIIVNEKTLNQTLKLTGLCYIVFNGNDSISNEEGGDVLVTMGGADQNGLTLTTAKALTDCDLKSVIIISEKSKDYEEIKNLIKNHANIKLIKHVDNFIGFLKNFKLVILNGGLTRYEAIYAGVPFLAISIHEIQFKITQKVTNYNVGINMGIINKIDHNTIKNKIDYLFNNPDEIKKMKSNTKGLLSKNGAFEIKNQVLSGYKNFIYEKNDKKSKNFH
jgi:UDP-2,4-diacetamido-2,4,6-trideoxy-beta-L-altropyranose hydrolase